MLSSRDPGRGVPPIDEPWPVADIAYTAIIAPIMLMAFLEWTLWLLAFLYCLWKVFWKADENKWTVRTLCVANAIFFVLLRCIFAPIMVVTLPLPAQLLQYFPEEMVQILQWFAFYSFAALLIVPWLFCVYQLVTHNIGRQRRIKNVLEEHSAPKVVIIMPCYNEEPEILLRTIDSIVDCEYPPSCLHVFLSFDGDQENELYLNTLGKLGVPLTLDSYPKSIDVIYRSCRITVSRFPHGGKRGCQKKTYKLIDKIYAEYLRRNDNLFLLFIDSDCILDKVCIQNFMYEMELKPGSKHNMLAMTGVITSTTVKNSLITVLQDMEYIHGQLFERSVESGCGAVTCLPGALTILRFSAFRKMAKYYFADKAEQCDDLFDYGKCHLGEDRWLTHLFMIGAQERYQIQMNTSAFCKTEAVQSFKSLLKQRRRWFLGFMTNEVCMLTDIRLWKRYPILLVIRLAQNTIRTTALLFFIMVISLITTSQKVDNLPVGFIAVSLGLNWVLMLYFGAKLGRFKIMLYPLMFVLNPFFNWLYMVYGIFTCGQRTWGGPRADAGKADDKVSPEQAVAEAEAKGDDLNIVPETFKPAMELDRARSGRQAPLMPSSRLEGRFAPAEQLPGGWYNQLDVSTNLHADMTLREGDADEEMVIYHRGSRRDSSDSVTTSHASIALPQRMESIFGLEDLRQYHAQLEAQRPAGGAFLESGTQKDCSQTVPTYSSDPLHRPHDQAPSTSLRFVESNDSIALHFRVPVRPTAPPSDGPSLQTQASTPPLRTHRSTRPSDRDRNRDPVPLGPIPPIPQASRPPPTRLYADQGSAARTGRSPLARRSFTRLAADDAPAPGMRGDGQTTEPSTDHEEVPRGRRRRRRRRGRGTSSTSTAVSTGSDGRRRLSKQPPQRWAGKRSRGASPA